jgi:hypothetical protein
MHAVILGRPAAGGSLEAALALQARGRVRWRRPPSEMQKADGERDGGERGPHLILSDKGIDRATEEKQQHGRAHRHGLGRPGQSASREIPPGRSLFFRLVQQRGTLPVIRAASLLH